MGRLQSTGQRCNTAERPGSSGKREGGAWGQTMERRKYNNKGREKNKRSVGEGGGCDVEKP